MIAIGLLVLVCLALVGTLVWFVIELRQASTDAKIARALRYQAPPRAESLTTIIPPRPSQYDWSDK